METVDSMPGVDRMVSLPLRGRVIEARGWLVRKYRDKSFTGTLSFRGSPADFESPVGKVFSAWADVRLDGDKGDGFTVGPAAVRAELFEDFEQLHFTKNIDMRRGWCNISAYISGTWDKATAIEVSGGGKGSASRLVKSVKITAESVRAME